MWVSLVRLGGRLIMVSHGLLGGLQGSCAFLYRFALRVLWFPCVAGWPLCVPVGAGQFFFFGFSVL